MSGRKEGDKGIPTLASSTHMSRVAQKAAVWLQRRRRIMTRASVGFFVPVRFQNVPRQHRTVTAEVSFHMCFPGRDEIPAAGSIAAF